MVGRLRCARVGDVRRFTEKKVCRVGDGTTPALATSIVISCENESSRQPAIGKPSSARWHSRASAFLNVFANANSKTRRNSFHHNHRTISRKRPADSDNCVVALKAHQPQMISVSRVSIANRSSATPSPSERPRGCSTTGRPHDVRDKSFIGICVRISARCYPEKPAIEKRSIHERFGTTRTCDRLQGTVRNEDRARGTLDQCGVHLSVRSGRSPDGYEVYVVEDCCGDVSPLAHDHAMKRLWNVYPYTVGAKPIQRLSCSQSSKFQATGRKDTYGAS